MHSTGSFLYTVLERIRGYLDDPDFDAKYDNDFLIRHIISPTMVDVLARINMNADNAVVMRLDFTPNDPDEYYQLPPSVGEVLRIARRDADGCIEDEVMPRTEFHPHGVGWALEGNTLRFDPKFGKNEQDYTIYYIPSGDVMPHYSDNGGTMTLDGSTLSLDSSPDLGSVDRRENAYAGQILRVIPATGLIEERVISSHEAEKKKVEVRIPFKGALSANVRYEIAPIGMQSLYEAISAGAAMKLGAYRKISGSHYQMVLQQYRSAIKTVTDNLANMQMRTGKSYQRKTVDNPAYNDLFFNGVYTS